MNEKKYLSEEKYQKAKKKIKNIALFVLIIGLLIGGSLILIGIKKQSDVNSKYSEENKSELQQQLDIEKEKLIDTKTELEKEIKEKTDIYQEQINALNTELASLKSQKNTEFSANGFSERYYSLENEINDAQNEISSLKSKINDENKMTESIDEAVEDGSSYCNRSKADNNSYTKDYCSLIKQIHDLTDFNKKLDSSYLIPFYSFGGIIILASCSLSGTILLITKRREMMAFTAQQAMPVAKEGIDEMAPVVGKAAGEIMKSIKKGSNDTNKE